MRSSWFALLCLHALILPALAQTGVSDDRVSLPEGPGSLEGVGENVSVGENMGQMSHQVPIVVPQGYRGLTPDLTLRYSSGGGSGVVGIGWDLLLPSIERLTLRGLPEYHEDDEFAVNGGEQLVRIPDTDPPVYRARFERSFVRYTWHDAGAEGYWRAEYPDGRIATFGAAADGTLAPEARVSGDEGTFRYHLVEMTDRYGHRIEYTWSRFGNVALPLAIRWVFADDTARYEVTFGYEDRDDKLSDCKAGFEELLEVRLATIFVRTAGETLRRYHLTYEDLATSGGFSRLTEVAMEGLDGGIYPVRHSFEYSQSLGADCDGSDCTKPQVVAMPTPLGVSLSQGNTTLIDIDGDGLADILDTSQAGAHRFFINALSADGTSHDFASPVASSVGTQSSHDLSSKVVQVLDVDGDGYADLLNAQQGTVLKNRGAGDWTAVESLWADSTDGGLPSDFVPEDGEIQTVRFMDYDGDKRVDVVKSTGQGDENVTQIYRSTGVGSFELDEGVTPMELGFDAETVELNDMNGDGLLDPIQVQADQIRYRLNYGRGQWGPIETIGGFTFLGNEAVEAELEDLNGDALADLVLVSGNAVRYWLNRNGASFDGERTVTSDDVDGDLPAAEDEVVLFADLNGSGSSDVVWIDQSGSVTYLELFPVRPNLLTRITNGIGKVTEVTYGTSALEMARDGGWEHPIPTAMVVVTALSQWDELNGVVQQTQYRYRDGFYDGDEKAFRGYGAVEVEAPGDDRQRTGTTISTFDVGNGNPYRAGLALAQESWEDGAILERTETTWTECDVEGVPDSGLLFDVRHQCATLEQTELREGLGDSSRWVTLETAKAYDGYGNVILLEERGVTAVGGQGCDACVSAGAAGVPCGDQCLGDERYERTEYAAPASNQDRWILDRPVRVRQFAVSDGGEPTTEEYSEVLNYYDGEDFVGRDLGEVTHGSITRVVARVNAAGDTVTLQRWALDGHGNRVEGILPNGSLDVADDHRRRWTWDPWGLRWTRVESLLTDEDGPYVLAQEQAFDPVFDRLVEASDLYVVGEAEPHRVQQTLDEFGRVIAIVRPGATPDMPSSEHHFSLESPVSRIVTRSRTAVGAETDLQTVQCFDGQGRRYQTRTLIEPGRWLVSGFVVFGAQSGPREIYESYETTTEDCDLAPPAGTPVVTSDLDSLGRVVRTVYPTLEGEDTPPVTETTFEPLVTIRWDAEDTREGGPHAGTPTTQIVNGLGHPIRVERLLTPGGDPLVTAFEVDETGAVTRMTDPGGYTRTQTFDLLGRLTSIEEVDRGLVTLEYDAAGNLTARTDPTGMVTRYSYDGANRPRAAWRDGAEAETIAVQRWDRAPSDCPASACSNVAGRLASATYPLPGGQTGEDRFGYDIMGLEVWTERRIGDLALAFDEVRDHAGRAVLRRFPSGLEVTRTLDGAGRVMAIDGYVDEVTYDGRGRPLSMALHNGVGLVRAYDALNRSSVFAATGPGGAVLMAHDLAWDRQGNLLSVTDGRADDSAPMAAATYAYDALYHLTTATLDPGRPAFTETLSFEVDASERLLSRTSDQADSPANLGALTYGDGANPRAVTQAGTLTYAYDAAGRMVERGSQTLEWDHHGRLARVQEGGSEVARFGYTEGMGRVLVEGAGAPIWTLAEDAEIRDWSLVVSIGGAFGRVARIEDPSFAATVLSDLAPATGSDAALTPEPDTRIAAGDAWIAQGVGAGELALASADAPSDVGDLLDAANRQALLGGGIRVRYELQDHLGNAVVVTGEAGEATSRTEYYPYGQVRHGAEPERGYTGKERDATGLIYFGHRYLDPVAGRWTAPDRAFEVALASAADAPAAFANAYAYVRNNPTSLLDPDGRDDNHPAQQQTAAMSIVVTEFNANGPDRVVARVAQAPDPRARFQHVNGGRGLPLRPQLAQPQAQAQLQGQQQGQPRRAPPVYTIYPSYETAEAEGLDVTVEDNGLHVDFLEDAADFGRLSNADKHLLEQAFKGDKASKKLVKKNHVLRGLYRRANKRQVEGLKKKLAKIEKKNAKLQKKIATQKAKNAPKK